jgi:N-glycosidase YbiA
MNIKFYKLKDMYGCFSNFSRHSFELDGRIWKTSEHYFQAQKYVNTPRFEQIADAETPRIAADLGRDRSIPLRHDWEQVKDDMMRKAVRAKVEQHPTIKSLLLSTGDDTIMEDSPIDYYWGIGADGTGFNMLGKILMEIRDDIRKDII